MRLIDADAYIKYCDENWIPLNADEVEAQPTIKCVKVVYEECTGIVYDDRTDYFPKKPEVSE